MRTLRRALAPREPGAACARKHPDLVARDREGATTDAVLPNVDRASIAAALDGVVTPANRFVCDGGKAIVAFAHRAKIPVHVVPARARAQPRGPRPPYQQRQRLSRPAQGMEAPLPRRRHQEPGMGRPGHSAKLDPRRHRDGALSTDNVIRASPVDHTSCSIP